MSGGGDWAEEIQDFLQAGDLNPNGVVIGLGSQLPPPLNTYLIVGIVYYSAGNTYGYTGIRFNGTQYITETGLVLPDNTIVPVSYMAEQVYAGRPAIKTLSDAIFAGKRYLMGFINGAGVPSPYMSWDFDSTDVFQFGDVTIADCFLNLSNTPVLNGQGVAFTPSITGGGAFALSNSTTNAVQYCIGSLVDVTVYLNWGSTANQGTGSWTFGGLPPMRIDSDGLSAAVGQWWYVKPGSAQRATGPILMAPGASTFICEAGGGTPTLAPVTALGAAVPEAWAVGAQLKCHLNYVTSAPF